jgi:hypothetical protein
MASIDELKSVATSKLGFAKANQFLVELPPIGSGGFGGIGGFLANLLPISIPNIPGILETGNPTTREMNILCSNATLPGKQILTTDRRIGMEFQKVAYGYAVDDVSLTFYLMNDYGVKDYFDAWANLVLNQETGEVGYKQDYAKTVKIHQLRRPRKGFSANIGPLTGTVDIGGGTIYAVELVDAFPTTISGVQLSNELDGLVQLSVQLSYTKWNPVKVGLQNFVNANLNFG